MRVADHYESSMIDRSQRRQIVVGGREFGSLESAARAYGMSRNTIDYRLAKGWTPEEACGLAPRPSHAAATPGIPVTVQGREFKNIKAAAKHFGRSYTHTFARLKDGCAIEQALGLIRRADSLQSEYPEVAKQWHPSRNKSLTAGDVTPHSGQKVWWLCPNGHEWCAVINSRTRRLHGCPYCAGQKPTATRNFATEYPALLAEWDWDKNGGTNPHEMSPRGKGKVWWKCAKGHSWQALVCNRTREGTKNQCAVCQNRILTDANSLASVRPDLIESWHPTKNVPLTPKDVIAGGARKVWWICRHGHEWQTTVGARVNAGTGCSKCSLQTSRIEIVVYAELEALFGAVAWREKIGRYECDIYLTDSRIGIEIDGVYWHGRRPEQEIDKSAAFEAAGINLFRLREVGLPLLSARDVAYKSSEDEFVVTSRLVDSLLKHAEFAADQAARLQGYLTGPGLVNERRYRNLVANLPAPPPGQSLADKYPDVARQWALDLNAPLSPEHFRPQANKKVWWRCESGHTWRTTPNIRVFQGTGCPHCPRKATLAPEDRNLAVLNPQLASEWHPAKNGELQPAKVWPNSNNKVWWRCSNDHEWQATVASRASGSGCPYCYGRVASKENNLAYRYPELLTEWDQVKNAGLNPSDFTPHVGRKVWWFCKNGHSWQATIYNRAKNRSGCPACARGASRKYTIDDFRSIAESRGGRCLSEQFTSVRRKLQFQCKEGHIWNARGDGIVYTENWCPTCGRKR